MSEPNEPNEEQKSIGRRLLDFQILNPRRVDSRKIVRQELRKVAIGGAIQIIGGIRPATRRPSESPAHWQFRLNFERGEIIYEPTEAQINSGLTSLRIVEGDSYCILDRHDVGFVQAMCGVNGLHVEWCDVPDRDWTATEHYKAGYHRPAKQTARCTKAVYHLPGFDNELLRRKDARVVFLAFRHSRGKPTAYVWRKMDRAELD